MELKELIQSLRKSRGQTTLLAQYLSRIASLESSNEGDVFALRSLLEKAAVVLAGLDRGASPYSDIGLRLEQLSRRVEQMASNLQSRLAADLDKALRQRNMGLSGQPPLYRTGSMIYVELDLDKRKARLWYGPKETHLKDVPLAPEKVAVGIVQAREQLGSGLPVEDFLRQLRRAFDRWDACQGTKRRERAPIIAVLAELAFVRQGNAFRGDPKKENYRPYSRADFSFDLFAARSSKAFTLGTAPRGKTGKADSLWVPGSERGDGNRYSHLEVRERPL